MSSSNAEENWNEVYSSGTKYQEEAPIPFINTIIKQIAQDDLVEGKGLYIGCGNGRNYIPLRNIGLDITGLDISQVALDQLVERNPELSEKLIHADFLNFDSTSLFDYIISIQVFQHGNWEQIQKLFEKVATLSAPGGLFFLRVRSTNMEIKNTYTIVDRTTYGGFTVHFEEGSKKDLDIHYFSIDELNFLTEGNFTIVDALKEVISTTHGKTISHIEAVWKKL